MWLFCKYRLLSHRFQLHRANDMTLTTARLKISSSVTCLWCMSVKTLIQSISTVCGYIFFLQVKKKLHSFFLCVPNKFFLRWNQFLVPNLHSKIPASTILIVDWQIVNNTDIQFKELNLLQYIFYISFSSLSFVLRCFILDNSTGHFRKKLCAKCCQ